MITEMITVHGVIDKQLGRLYTLFVETGELTGEQYVEMVKPLHEALLALTITKEEDKND